MSIMSKINALRAAALTVALVLPGLAVTPVHAKPGAFKSGFNNAARGVKPAKPPRRGGAGRLGAAKRPGLPKVTRPHGKPKMNPGLPNKRRMPETMGGRRKGQLKDQFNKSAVRKPLRDTFNPLARPPSKPPSGDPPPTPHLKPKGPTF